MIPQYSWCCDGMRVRAPTDAASEKARDRGEAKRQYAAQQMDLPSRTDASNHKHFLCRPAAPLQAPTHRVSKATNGVTPGPLHSRRRVVQGVQPPTLRHQRHPRTALPSLARPQRCPKSSTKAPRPGHPAHGTSMRPIRVPKKQKYAQNCNFFAKRIVVTEQFLRKTRVSSMPIRPSSSTEPQGIDHASTHVLTLGKNPALARLKNATSEEKRWAK